MKLSIALKIAGAITAAVAVVPPVVGMFHAADSTPSITINGPNATFNSSPRAIDQITNYNNSTTTSQKPKRALFKATGQRRGDRE
ncbi:hypothetical protein [Paraburkholderia sp. EG304]|uniref:hypothetical protein n=1 Tax=Paraburkholderia sp. EG304 TaxID=3237015 RepID=UPI00397DEA6D